MTRVHPSHPGQPAAAPQGPGHQRPGSSRRAVIVMTGLLLLMIGGGMIAGAVMRAGSGGGVTPQKLAQQTEAPPSGQADKPVAATNAELMGLEKLSAAHAPGFTLTDQNGHRISLSQLDRNHAVVLSFMDDRCTDICPLVAQEIADAYRNLGPRAADVEFVAVNVNAAHNGGHWLRSFIATHGPELASVPTFHYVTGTPAALRTVWSDYHITVKVDPNTGNVYHSEGMYFIAPGGTSRYEATPFANLRKDGTGWLPTATITQWGQGIAQYAEKVSAAPGSAG